MRPKSPLTTAAVVVVLSALAVTPSMAQTLVARSYTMVPKDGMSAQFEAALKNHLQWRADNGDPWTWGVSTLEVGEGVGEYGVRSSGHSWADLDSYDAEFGQDAVTHFRATVGPLLESISSGITTINEEWSHRVPPGTQLGFVTVTRFNIRPDRQADFAEAVAQAVQALKDHDWPGHWVWEAPMAGGGVGPYMQVVALHENWADMQEPDPPMLAVMEQAMGSSAYQAWLTTFGESIRGQVVTVRRLRPDLNAS